MLIKYLAALVTVLVLVVCPAAAETAAAVRSIVLTGHGEVTTAPDIAVLSLGVATHSKSAKDALKTNTAAMQKLFAVLKAAGIADKDMQTSGFSVNPRYDYGDGKSPPRADGFDVANSVAITVRKLDQLGAVLDAAVGAGSNQINGLSFGVDNPASFADEARKRAALDARRKAEIYATAADFILGPIISISEGNAYQPQPVVFARAKMESDAAAVPIAQGEQVITVDVNIVWEIK
jgi:uncharacterized protein